MDINELNILQKIAHTVRALSADAIEKQKSGHPGLPLGASEIGAYLYAKVLRHNPENPDWMGRDRFVLSAGHGSMLLYSLLHLSGYDVSMDEIKNFRQLHSLTPGHPEHGETPGVETTAGPLGQGVAAATGMAIAQKLLAARFGDDLFSARIWALAGDGCLMEGISAEAGSLAGTLGLDNLTIIYDSNDICLDGPTRDCILEDTGKRYESYGFRVIRIDGHDLNEIEEAFKAAINESNCPVLIIAKTTIGKYAPNIQGKSAAHGKYLGAEEMKLFKSAIGWPEEPLFYVPPEVSEYFTQRRPALEKLESEWNDKLQKMQTVNPEKAALWKSSVEKRIPQDFEQRIWNLEIKPGQPTRRYSEAVVSFLGKNLPFLITGSADVASCDFTWLPESSIVSKGNWQGQQIRFGVREFSMAACAYGMSLHGMLQPVVGTFLIFSDYMRNAIRMSALMKQKVIFVFSHGSILLAQDGPTHQPVEQLMSLRLIPNLTLIRPADENETKAAWMAAMKIEDCPVALCFTRQPIQSLVSHLTQVEAKEGVQRGAYFLYGSPSGKVDVKIYATGSEIHPAFGAAQALEREGLTVRLISVPSWELFDQQPEAYKQSISGSNAGLKVSVEAGSGLGWQKFVGEHGLIISQEQFGASAPEPVMADHFGFTADKIAARILQHLSDM